MVVVLAEYYVGNLNKNKVLRCSFLFMSIFLLLFQLIIPLSSYHLTEDSSNIRTTDQKTTDDTDNFLWQPTTISFENYKSQDNSNILQEDIISSSSRFIPKHNQEEEEEEKKKTILNNPVSNSSNKSFNTSTPSSNSVIPSNNNNNKNFIHDLPTNTINTTTTTTMMMTNNHNNNHHNTTTILPPPQPLPSIIINLRGQLGNNLCGIAHGKGIQLLLQRYYGLDTQLLLQPPNLKKNRQFRYTKLELEQCFPTIIKTSSFTTTTTGSGEEGGEGELRSKRREQMKWLSSIQYKVLSKNTTTTTTTDDDDNNNNNNNNKDLLSSILSQGVNGGKFLINNHKVDLNEGNLMEALRLFREVSLLKQRNDNDDDVVQATQIKKKNSSSSKSNHTITIPFLIINILESEYMVDHFYDDLRQYLAFDESCCKELPAPDETVFHFRNFATNVGSHKDASSIFVELSANKTANELLGHLNPGDKVAITSRYHNEETNLYVKALEARGLQVRVVTGQSGMQDFCFLAKAQKELVGNAISTYCKWAAILGNATTARLYITDRPYFRYLGKGHDLVSFFGYNWTNPVLQHRIKFEVYKTEETVDYWSK